MTSYRSRRREWCRGLVARHKSELEGAAPSWSWVAAIREMIDTLVRENVGLDDVELAEYYALCVAYPIEMSTSRRAWQPA